MIQRYVNSRFFETFTVVWCIAIILSSYALGDCAIGTPEPAALDPETSRIHQALTDFEKVLSSPDMNAEVEKALNLFKGPERAFFLQAYRRSGRYRPGIVKALRRAGLPETFSWLPLIESGFSPTFMSHARALGLWQFIAATGYKCGLKRNRWVDERMNPDKSTRAAMFNLARLYHVFGDWMTVLAAHYCGEGRVLRTIDNHQIDYRNDFRALYAKLPKTTAFNIPRFLAVLQIVKDPATHGFALPAPEPEIRCDIVTVHKQLHLKTLAQFFDVDSAELKALNPDLLQEVTPDGPYDLRVREGKGNILE